MPTPRTTHDLRCTCSRSTKLAEYGATKDGKPYVWLRIFKQARVFGEVIATSGDVNIRCRDCGRFTLVTIRRADIDVVDDATPAAFAQ